MIMSKEDYEWHFTFSSGSGPAFTISKQHPDFDYIRSHQALVLTSASLVDRKSFSIFDEEDEQMKSFVRTVFFEPKTHLIRSFWRTEVRMPAEEICRVPALEIQEDQTKQYIFVTKNSYIKTPNSRPNLSDLND